ncbi:MAG: Gfo/Idh/MocA family oxidoreductase [Gemmatimonadota bacterium]|nr:MAG: Gfo/Idh/MocA family oxidoreductase [Gemmatimonadota bacterium]
MTIKRRDLIKAGAGAAVSASLFPNLVLADERAEARADRKLRLGFIGVGGRGTWLLGLALRRDDCEIKAVCDVKPDRVERARNMVKEAHGETPRGFADGEEDFLKLVERDDMDAVIIATPWLWHAPMAVAAMKSGKAVGVEVPAAVTEQECWDLVNTSEATAMPCMLMENVCYRRDVMAVLNMVRQGLFGELVHCHCGYQHDLREVKFRPGVQFGPGAEGEAEWRTEHSIRRNGDIYPTHGVGPVAKFLDINYGNRFVSLTSTATKTRGLHNYIVEHGGEDHPNAKVEFALGDIVTTVIRTSNGETVIVSHDTNLPRPYSLNFRLQGTKGLWMVDNRSVYIEGVSPESHRWEPFDKYQEEYDHPLWKRYAGESEGAGHGGMDFFVMHAFIESVKRRVPPPIDVYDAATWSVISALSERSISMGSAPMEFPDFTRGRWVTRRSSFAMGDEF